MRGFGLLLLMLAVGAMTIDVLTAPAYSLMLRILHPDALDEPDTLKPGPRLGQVHMDLDGEYELNYAPDQTISSAPPSAGYTMLKHREKIVLILDGGELSYQLSDRTIEMTVPGWAWAKYDLHSRSTVALCRAPALRLAFIVWYGACSVLVSIRASAGRSLASPIELLVGLAILACVGALAVTLDQGAGTYAPFHWSNLFPTFAVLGAAGVWREQRLAHPQPSSEPTVARPQ